MLTPGSLRAVSTRSPLETSKISVSSCASSSSAALDGDLALMAADQFRYLAAEAAAVRAVASAVVKAEVRLRFEAQARANDLQAARMPPAEEQALQDMHQEAAHDNLEVGPLRHSMPKVAGKRAASCPSSKANTRFNTSSRSFSSKVNYRANPRLGVRKVTSAAKSQPASPGAATKNETADDRKAKLLAWVSNGRPNSSHAGSATGRGSSSASRLVPRPRPQSITRVIEATRTCSTRRCLTFD